MEWSKFNIFCLMLGIGVNMNPRRCLRTKIIYILLSLISMFFISDLLSDLTEIKFEITEKPIIQSFEDILEKNVTVIFNTNYLGFKALQGMLAGSALNILEISKIPEKNELYAYDKVWIMTYDNAEKMLSSTNNILGGIKHEIIDFTLYQSQNILTFNHNSPLRNKFHKTFTKISEAGLDVKWKSDYDNANKISKTVDNNHLDNDNNIFVLLVVMVVGVGSAVISFLLECLWYYGKKCLQKNKRSKFLKLPSFASKKNKPNLIKIRVQPRSQLVIEAKKA